MGLRTGRIIRFRNLQQKLGFYSFLVSLLALAVVSSLTYRVARSQIRSDREQLMGIEAGQIVQQLGDELRNAEREVKVLGEMEIVQTGLRNPGTTQLASFLDDLLKH